MDQALKIAGALIAAGSLDMFALWWFATVDTPERWIKLLARQPDAYAQGEGIFIYHPPCFLHYPRFHAFVVGPVMAYSTFAPLVGLAVSAFAVRMERRRNQQQLADAKGDEVNG